MMRLSEVRLPARAAVHRRRMWESTVYEIQVREDGREGEAPLKVELPSVTTVLKSWPSPELERWKLKQVAAAWRDNADKGGYSDLGRLINLAVDRTALRRGVACHRALEDHFSGRSVEPAYESVLSRILVAVGREAQAKLSEVPVVGDGYAGTADLLGRTKDGFPCVLDLKTGKGVWESNWAQVYAYASSAWLVTGGRLRRMPEGMRAGVVHAPLNGPVDSPELVGEVEVVWLGDRLDSASRMWELSLLVHQLRKELDVHAV